MSIELRDYQADGIEEMRQAFRHHRRIVYRGATGSGKGTMIPFMAGAAMSRGRRVLTGVHRKELVRNLSERFDSAGIPHVVIDAKAKRPMRAQAAVASIQTLARRLEHYAGQFDFIIIDEAHHCLPENDWGKLLAAFNDAQACLYSATPCRLDSRGMGEVADHMVIGPEERQLIDWGHLADWDAKEPPGGAVDMSGVRSRFGDFAPGAVASMLAENPAVFGDPIEHYVRHTPGRPGVMFCINIRHAEMSAEAFRAAGVRAESIDGRMDEGDRAALLGGLANGELDILTSCTLIDEGVDVPGISVVIDCSPTKSIRALKQRWGRGMRPKPNGGRLQIFDHTGNARRVGILPDTPIKWTLDGMRKVAGAGPVRTCKECFSIYPAAAGKCPQCGTAPKSEPKPRKLESIKGDLVDARAQWLAADGRPAVERRKEDINAAVAKCSTWEDLEGLRKVLGFKPGWSARIAESLGWRVIRGSHGFAIKAIPPRREIDQRSATA